MTACRFEVHHRTLGACSVSTTGPSPAIRIGRPSSLVRLGAPYDRVLDGAGSLRPTPACMNVVSAYTIGEGGGW